MLLVVFLTVPDLTFEEHQHPLLQQGSKKQKTLCIGGANIPLNSMCFKSCAVWRKLEQNFLTSNCYS